MDLKEYLQLKKQIEDKHNQELSALELLWKNHGKTDSESSEDQKRNISHNVRQVIKALEGNFSIKDITDGLKNLGFGDVSQAQLSNLLSRLMKREEIEITEKGKGRMPNQYKLIKKSSVEDLMT